MKKQSFVEWIREIQKGNLMDHYKEIIKYWQDNEIKLKCPRQTITYVDNNGRILWVETL